MQRLHGLLAVRGHSVIEASLKLVWKGTAGQSGITNCQHNLMLLRSAIMQLHCGVAE